MRKAELGGGPRLLTPSLGFFSFAWHFAGFFRWSCTEAVDGCSLCEGAVTPLS